jgi:PEP-CTERM motif-containing protein
VFDNATVAGTYTFDSTMAQVLATPNSGGYAGSGGIFNMNVAFTGTLDPSVDGPYIADTLNITVNNVFSGPLDEYLVTGTSSTDSALTIEIRLDDFSGTAFSNTSLPLTPPSLAAFTSVRFALFDGTLDNPIEAEGVLRTLQCTAGCGRTVPEPNAMLLFGIALGALWLVRHPRRRSLGSPCLRRT